MTVSIEIDHPEVCDCRRFQKNEPVGTHTKPSVTDSVNEIRIAWKMARPIVYNHKIIAGSLVFEKICFHEANVAIFG